MGLDLVSFWFIVLVVVLGGAIAYFADQLGRKLGKKRLTLGGLRPRHTAALITVATGMLIPFLTILLVAAFSSDVRIWLREGRSAIRDRDALRKEVAGLAAQRIELERQNADRQQKLIEANRTLAATNRRLRQTQESLTQSRELLAREAGKLRAARERVAALGSQVSRLLASVKTMNLEIRSTETKLVTANQRLGTVRQAFDTVEKERREAYDENIRLGNENARFQRQIDDMQRAVSDLSAGKAGLEAEIEQAGRQLDDAKRELEQGRLELDQMKTDLDRMQASIAFLSSVVDNSRISPMILPKGAELARLSLEPNLSPGQAQAALSSLLRNARRAATDMGAAVGRDGIPAAGLFTRKGEDGRDITPEEQESLILKEITGADQGLVLIARSLVNAFQKEPVALEIRPFRNPLVYRAGETVAEGRIDGGLSIGQIYQQLTAFMQNQVKAAAQRSRMIPVVGQDISFGSIETQEILDLVQQLKYQDKVVRLIAFVDQDTRAGDRLDLKFRIR